MKTLYLERSVSTGRNGDWVNELDLAGVERIVVGMGPGSFAGIRSALAFARGYALGRSLAVFGLPSPCAVAAGFFRTAGQCPLAVVGDARRGMCWIALFDGYALTREVFQVVSSALPAALPPEMPVVTPDAARIGDFLRETFGERYRGGMTPTAADLEAFVLANPSALVRDPLPIYLNPAVRP